MTILGIPIIGPFFVPIIVGVATIFALWMFIFSEGSLQSAVSNDKSRKSPDAIDDFFPETKAEAKEKKGNKCSSNGGCCSRKDGNTVGCSPKNRAIETARVFIDGNSTISQECGEYLSKQLIKENITVDCTKLTDTEIIQLPKHADGPLCIFLSEFSSLNGGQHWLEKKASILLKGEKPLTGVKYTVFIVHSCLLDKSKVEEIDQVLHKLGAIRVCRPGGSNLPLALSPNFTDWSAELIAQVSKWNTPKKTSCKCGPKTTKEDQSDDSCESSKCSDFEEEKKSVGILSNPILDLEDIAKLL